MDQIQRVAKQVVSLLVILANLTTLMMSLNLVTMILMNLIKRESQEREVQEAAEILMIPVNLTTLMMSLILMIMILLNLMILMMSLNLVTMIPMIPMNLVKRENQEGAV